MGAAVTTWSSLDIMFNESLFGLRDGQQSFTIDIRTKISRLCGGSRRILRLHGRPQIIEVQGRPNIRFASSGDAAARPSLRECHTSESRRDIQSLRIRRRVRGTLQECAIGREDRLLTLTLTRKIAMTRPWTGIRNRLRFGNRRRRRPSLHRPLRAPCNCRSFRRIMKSRPRSVIMKARNPDQPLFHAKLSAQTRTMIPPIPYPSIPRIVHHLAQQNHQITCATGSKAVHASLNSSGACHSVHLHRLHRLHHLVRSIYPMAVWHPRTPKNDDPSSPRSYPPPLPSPKSIRPLKHLAFRRGPRRRSRHPSARRHTQS